MHEVYQDQKILIDFDISAAVFTHDIFYEEIS